MIWNIFVATVPAAVAGLMLHDAIEQIRSPVLIFFTLSSVAALMILTERKRKDSPGLGIDKIGRKDALVIGFAQALALIPGVSRSGITIIAGLIRGFERRDAARFSFLLSTPVVAGASVYEAKKLFLSDNINIEFDLFFAGIVISAVTGYLAIKYLLRFLQNHSLNSFAYYRFFLAFVIIIAVWAQ
jgi:undecaprenyl-diphosphatase